MSGLRFDYENQVCDKQAFTGAATVSTDSYKKGSAAQDLSIGRRLVFLVLPVVNAGAGSTVLLEAIQADNGALTTNVEVIGQTSVPAAKFIKGKEIEIGMNQGVMSKQYLGIRVTITGGTTTATLDAYIVPMDEVAYFKSFPKVNNVG